MASNIPRLAVTALAERLRITGFTGDPDLWADWIRNDLDQLSGVAHGEALLLGDSFVMVWADIFGRPKVTVESARQVAVQTDPGTRQVVAAVKRWEDDRNTHAVLYLPDTITRLRANQTGATTCGFMTVEEIANPLMTVLVVPIRNSDPHPRRPGSVGDRRSHAASRCAEQVAGRHDGDIGIRWAPSPLGDRN